MHCGLCQYIKESLHRKFGRGVLYMPGENAELHTSLPWHSTWLGSPAKAQRSSLQPSRSYRQLRGGGPCQLLSWPCGPEGASAPLGRGHPWTPWVGVSWCRARGWSYTWGHVARAPVPTEPQKDPTAEGPGRTINRVSFSPKHPVKSGINRVAYRRGVHWDSPPQNPQVVISTIIRYCSTNNVTYLSSDKKI